jgi:iron complex transport system substrate-binding protein
MGGLKGETGASPVLLRNCKEDQPPSQVARLTWVSHNLAERRWKRTQPCLFFTSLSTPPGSFCLYIRNTHPRKQGRMMKTTIKTLLLALLVLAMAACSPGAKKLGQPLNMVDGLGRSVNLDGPALRVVSLAPSNTEILYAVGAGGQVVGRDDFSNYPEPALQVTAVGGSMGDYNLEQIVSLKPDLVLAAEINTPEQVQALEKLDLTVFYVANPKDLGKMYVLLNTIATLTGHEAQASQMVTDLKARADKVQAALANVTERPKVFYELDGSEPSKPWTSGRDTYISQLIGMAGGENVADQQGADWLQMSQEALIIQNPDIILLGDAAYGTTAEDVAARAGWDAIRAVKESRIYPFNDDTVSRPGPRNVDALEELAKIIHPEALQP